MTSAEHVFQVNIKIITHKSSWQDENHEAIHSWAEGFALLSKSCFWQKVLIIRVIISGEYQSGTSILQNNKEARECSVPKPQLV